MEIVYVSNKFNCDNVSGKGDEEEVDLRGIWEI